MSSLCVSPQALQRYKTQSKSTESSDYEAMTAADSYFSNEAEASIRQGSDWDYQAERASLQVRRSPLIPPVADGTSRMPRHWR